MSAQSKDFKAVRIYFWHSYQYWTCPLISALVIADFISIMASSICIYVAQSTCQYSQMPCLVVCDVATCSARALRMRVYSTAQLISHIAASRKQR